MTSKKGRAIKAIGNMTPEQCTEHSIAELARYASSKNYFKE